MLTFLDYENKRAGIGPTMTLTGDVEADMARICAFYDGIKGRHPDRQGPCVLRSTPA